MSLFDRVKKVIASFTPEVAASSDPLDAELKAVDSLLDFYLAMAPPDAVGVQFLIKHLDQSRPEVRGVLGVEGQARGRMATALIERRKRFQPQDHTDYGPIYIKQEISEIASSLIAKKGSVAPADFPRLVDSWIQSADTYCVTYAQIVGVAEALVAAHGLIPEISGPIAKVHKRLLARTRTTTTENRKMSHRLQRILDPTISDSIPMTEPWQAPFLEQGPELEALLAHAATAKGTAMSEKWAKAARPLLAGFGYEPYLTVFEESVAAVAKMPRVVDTMHSDMLRGLAWFAGLTGSPRAASLLGRLVLASAHKVEGVGARSQKGFSGAVGALEKMGTFESLAVLSNARNRVKTPSLSTSLVEALQRAAVAQSLPMEELEELVVPTYGLELPGVRLETLGAIEVRLEIAGTTDAELRWFRDGKELKSPPADLKLGHAEELKELKAAQKEVEAALAAQRSRIEGMLLTGRTLPYPQWRERYLDHPLLANMCRRLIWRFDDANGERLGIAVDGKLADIEGRPFEPGAETLVRLWHPIHAGLSAIEAWREYLVVNEIRQPFKQAYREIYLLTDAERRTRTYSNRFAAHILKQHQFSALARQRGWRYLLQGFFDAYNTPSLTLPQWGLSIMYFVEVPDVNLPDDQRMTDAGISLYVVTDQVRFQELGTDLPVELEQIPPVVFSEVMRDVDLFVGVSSVGNDPAWADQGERAGYGAYWRSYSFGDLSASAETRKAVLQRLLPRLAIGKSTRIDGKFLVVPGNLRTYKIHLGSGNILMDPNDQYLCIVPGRSRTSDTDQLFLPFEGDGMLAIILSKAMMLAKDDKITDPSIVQQIKR